MPGRASFFCPWQCGCWSCFSFVGEPLESPIHGAESKTELQAPSSGLPMQSDDSTKILFMRKVGSALERKVAEVPNYDRKTLFVYIKGVVGRFPFYEHSALYSRAQSVLKKHGIPNVDALVNRDSSPFTFIYATMKNTEQLEEAAKKIATMIEREAGVVRQVVFVHDGDKPPADQNVYTFTHIYSLLKAKYSHLLGERPKILMSKLWGDILDMYLKKQLDPRGRPVQYKKVLQDLGLREMGENKPQDAQRFKTHVDEKESEAKLNAYILREYFTCWNDLGWDVEYMVPDYDNNVGLKFWSSKDRVPHLHNYEKYALLGLATVNCLKRTGANIHLIDLSEKSKSSGRQTVNSQEKALYKDNFAYPPKTWDLLALPDTSGDENSGYQVSMFPVTRLPGNEPGKDMNACLDVMRTPEETLERALNSLSGS